MCIFTSEVESVANTRIFARQKDSRQAIVYDMHLSTTKNTAMVLPIPVTNTASVHDVEFVDLSDYPAFFDDIESLFPQWMSASLDGPKSRGGHLIKVHQVGVFEASFVPSLDDFKYLDSRFSLNNDFFEQAPEYSEYGFVVFKLKPGKSKVHPMAFWFRKDNGSNLFFPTKHMHRGVVHENDLYSHTLYAQGAFEGNVDMESVDIENYLEDIENIADKSAGLVSDQHGFYKKSIFGEQENRDIWL